MIFEQGIVIFRMGYGKWHLLQSVAKGGVCSCHRFSSCRISSEALAVGITGREPRPAELRIANGDDVDKLAAIDKLCHICENTLRGENTPKEYVTAAMAAKLGLQIEPLSTSQVSVTRTGGACPMCKQGTMLPESHDPRQVVILRAGGNKIKGCDPCIRMLLDLAKPIPRGTTVSLKQE